MKPQEDSNKELVEALSLFQQLVSLITRRKLIEKLWVLKEQRAKQK